MVKIKNKEESETEIGVTKLPASKYYYKRTDCFYYFKSIKKQNC